MRFQALLEQMPHALRRAVLSDIYMATLRRSSNDSANSSHFYHPWGC